MFPPARLLHLLRVPRFGTMVFELISCPCLVGPCCAGGTEKDSRGLSADGQRQVLSPRVQRVVDYDRARRERDSGGRLLGVHYFHSPVLLGWLVHYRGVVFDMLHPPTGEVFVHSRERVERRKDVTTGVWGVLRCMVC